MTPARGGLALVVLLVACPALAGGMLGEWTTEQHDARVRVERCGDELCGTVVWMAEPRLDDGTVKTDRANPDPALRDRPVVGLRILHGFSTEPDGNGVWTGGRIYDPDSGKTYKCRAQLAEPDRLKIRGYVGLPLLGRTTWWTRVEPAAIPAR